MLETTSEQIERAAGNDREQKRGRDEQKDREIVISRVFAAPRTMVWAAWSDPWQVGQWWGPKGFRCTMTEMDQRAGGMWRLVMHGPDGTDYPNDMQFIEIVPKERVVFRTQGGRKGAPVVHFDTTMLFADESEGTRLTIRMTFATAAERDHNVRTYGSIEGGEQMLDRLASMLQQKQAGNPVTKQATHELSITRVFDAPRELVWRAWTDPEMHKQWAGPKPFPAVEVHRGSKPGDRWRICLRGCPPGTDTPVDLWQGGELREVVPPERLAFTFAWDKRANVGLEDDGGPHETLITVRLEEHDGKTTMYFNQAFFASAAERDGHNGGWSSSFERLEELLKAA